MSTATAEKVHAPAKGVHQNFDTSWSWSCACGETVTADSRTKCREASHAHLDRTPPPPVVPPCDFDDDVEDDDLDDWPVDYGNDGPVRYNLSINDEGDSIATFVVDGKVQTISTEDALFARVADALAKGEDPTPFLDGGLQNIDDDRIEVDDRGVTFEGFEVHSNLLSSFARYQTEGRDVGNLVKFLDRLAKNPSDRSREQLFNWSQARDLTIDEDGFLIGYKAVERTYGPWDTDGDRPLSYQSISAGWAYVDGTLVGASEEDTLGPYQHIGSGPSANIPNYVGAVVSIPREFVDDDPNSGCSFGLHVGSWNYASGFHRGGAVLEVQVDPANVVSVPSDCNFGKMRVSEYTVLAIHDDNVGDDLSTYEPPATWSTEEFEESLDTIEIPLSFRKRLKAKLSRRGRKVETVEPF